MRESKPRRGGYVLTRPMGQVWGRGAIPLSLRIKGFRFMTTLEAVREKIRKNFPKEQTGSDAKRQKLEWNRETMTTLISTCGTYRISRVSDSETETINYFVELAPTPTSAPKRIAGPYHLAKDARHAAQCHSEGIAMQADLGSAAQNAPNPKAVDGG